MGNRIIRKWYSVEDGRDICLAECESLEEAIEVAQTIDGRVEVFEYNVFDDGNEELSDTGCVYVKDNEKVTNIDFLDDRDKMIDFFNMDKTAFLEWYDYLSNEEYIETAKAIGYKVKFNDYENYDYSECEGMELGNIVYAAMMYDWINM